MLLVQSVFFRQVLLYEGMLLLGSWEYHVKLIHRGNLQRLYYKLLCTTNCCVHFTFCVFVTLKMFFHIYLRLGWLDIFCSQSKESSRDTSSHDHVFPWFDSFVCTTLLLYSVHCAILNLAITMQIKFTILALALGFKHQNFRFHLWC